MRLCTIQHDTYFTHYSAPPSSLINNKYMHTEIAPKGAPRWSQSTRGAWGSLKNQATEDRNRPWHTTQHNTTQHNTTQHGLITHPHQKRSGQLPADPQDKKHSYSSPALDSTSKLFGGFTPKSLTKKHSLIKADEGRELMHILIHKRSHTPI